MNNEPIEQDYNEACDELFQLFDVTTSVELRDLLRSKGFWVGAKECSRYLRSRSDLNVVTTTGLPYKQYVKPPPPCSNPLHLYGVSGKDPSIDPQTVPAETRNKARYFFARANNIRYTDTKAIFLK